MDEVTDEPLYRDRVCGIDIGKAQLVATIRVPSDRDPARRMAGTRTCRLVTGRSHRPRPTWPDQARLPPLAVTHRYKRAHCLWLE